MKIILDAMGGDNSPAAQVEGAFLAAAELGCEVVLVGKEEEINKVIKEKNLSDGKVSVVNADDVITMEDAPTSIRSKKTSSMAVCMEMLKNGEGDALVSSGNSGALLVGSTLFLRCIKGIKRAAFAPIFPTKTGKTVIVDSGANTECSSEMLFSFGIMGSVYMKKMYGIENPRVGLINNGAEECKGTPLYVETNKLLRESGKVNFIGNVEGRGVFGGECDCLVCDGFTGNIVLKTSEGAGLFFADEIKNIFYKNIFTKIGALFVMKGLKALKKRMDYKEVGGAVLLGISKPVIKAHGSSDARAVKGALRQAVTFASSDIIKEIENEYSEAL